MPGTLLSVCSDGSSELWLTRVMSAPTPPAPQDPWQCLDTFLEVTTPGVGEVGTMLPNLLLCTGHCPSPKHSKTLPGQKNINSAKVEKPWCEIHRILKVIKDESHKKEKSTYKPPLVC